MFPLKYHKMLVSIQLKPDGSHATEEESNAFVNVVRQGGIQTDLSAIFC